MSRKVIIIGAGFSGISAASHLAKKGYDVKVVEKHDQPGGRARKFQKNGFTFDMGPSWYWMHDVFERYFNSFGKKVSDYYDLVRLDPSYKVYYANDDELEVPANLKLLKQEFEKMETGSSVALDTFLAEAKKKYEIGINDLVYKPSLSINEFIQPQIIKNAFKLGIFQKFNAYTSKYFKNERIRQLMEFPILFLGGTGETTPALYSLMNYADFVLGTWYPMGGMHKVIEGMVSLAEDQGVQFYYNQNVCKVDTVNNAVKQLVTDKQTFEADIVVSGADYQFTEKKLLDSNDRSYSEKYWEKRVMSPSSLIFYLGIDKKLPIHHHNLFFDEDFSVHADEIYKNPAWPSKPSIYISSPSKTDPTVAPEGHENVFVLIPVAPGLEDTEASRERYFELFLNRFKKLTCEDIRNNIVFKKSYAHKDFEMDYNAFKGNAYGLANTLMQTAFLKPKLKSRKVKNLYYTGQLTVPGPGVPPALISGEVVADLIQKETKKSQHKAESYETTL